MTIQPETEVPFAPPPEPTTSVSTPPAPSAVPSTRRSSDYRLRGLDLDAHPVVVAPPRPVRRRHASIRRRRWRLLVQSLVVLAVVAAAAVALRALVFQPYSVTSTSMVPTLQPGTDVLVLKRDVFDSIDAGDIVVVHAPEGAACGAAGGARDLLSRVIAGPGQTIWSEGERIYIDGVRLVEPDWRNPPFGDVGTRAIERTTIPADRYFVMGDNRTDTCDSRQFGPIPESDVVGEVVATTARDGHPFVHFI